MKIFNLKRQKLEHAAMMIQVQRQFKINLCNFIQFLLSAPYRLFSGPDGTTAAAAIADNGADSEQR